MNFNSFWDIINVPLSLLIGTIYRFVGSYGLSIVLFSIVTEILLFPLSIKQQKSTVAMQKIMPKQQEIERKYRKTNPQKYQEEISKLYEKEKINPMGGCLPMLIQLPILISLYSVINRPLTYILGYGQDLILKIASVVNIEVTASTLRQKEIVVAEAMTANLASVEAAVGQPLTPINFNFLGLNLAQTPSFSHFSVLWIVPILSAVVAYLSQVWMTKNNPAMGGTAQTNSMMKSMNIMMPVMSIWLGFTLPAAVGVYWILRSLLMPAKQIFLNKLIRPAQTSKSRSGKKQPQNREIPAEFIEDLKTSREENPQAEDMSFPDEEPVPEERAKPEQKSLPPQTPNKYSGYTNSKKKKKK